MLVVFLLTIYQQDLHSHVAVPAKWVSESGDKSSILWGFILGMGFITYQAGTLFHLYLLLSIFSDNWWLSIMAGVVYGFTRSAVTNFPYIRKRILEFVSVSHKNFTQLSLIRKTSSILIILMSIIGIIVEKNHKNCPDTL